MDIFYAIIAGIIQGLTEFLPISSSGHLVLFHDFFYFNLPDDLAFDVVLHLGTLVSLLLFFHKDIFKYLISFFQSFIKWNLRSDVNQRLAWFLLISTFPAAIAGYFLEDQIETIFRSPLSVALILITFGIILYFADTFFRQIKTMDQLSLASSFLIGVFQALALVPGVSRSAITIIAGLSQKLKREEAARFSFLLSIPIVFGAGLKKTFDLSTETGLVFNDFIILGAGFLASAITGYFCIKYFLNFLQTHSLKIFAYYRVFLGLIIIFIILFFK